MTGRIVVLDAVAPRTAERMAALMPPGFTLDYAREGTEAARLALVVDADFAISGQVAVTRALLEAGRRLQLVHKWGVEWIISTWRRPARSASRWRGRRGATPCRWRNSPWG